MKSKRLWIEKLDDLIPPGADALVELRVYLVALGTCLLLSLQTLVSAYGAALDMRRAHTVELGRPISTDVMPPFSAFCGMLPVLLFVMTALCMISMIAHRTALTRESNPLYLLRRLPTRGEVFRRVYLLPLLGIAAAAGVLLVVYIFYFHLYLNMPEVHDPGIF